MPGREHNDNRTGRHGRVATPRAPTPFTIDLGSTKTINSINSSGLQVVPDYVFLPATITYEVSTNGSTYPTAGTVSRPAVSSALQVKTYRLISLNLSARYVRVVVDGGSAWSMVDEVEVRAS